MRSFTMTEAEYLAHEDNSEGLCVSCGHCQEGCEPDACRYNCEECNRRAVYGVSELLLMGQIEIKEAVESEVDYDDYF